MLKRSTLVTVLAALIVAAMAASSDAWIGEYNQLTFASSVALPGVVLPAGTYKFQVIASEVVRVTSPDGRQPYFMGLTHRLNRPRTLPAKSVITLGETPRGTPPPVTAWFPVGNVEGYGFIYR